MWRALLGDDLIYLLNQTAPRQPLPAALFGEVRLIITGHSWWLPTVGGGDSVVFCTVGR